MGETSEERDVCRVSKYRPLDIYSLQKEKGGFTVENLVGNLCISFLGLP